MLRRVQDSNLCRVKPSGFRNPCNWPLCEPSMVQLDRLTFTLRFVHPARVELAVYGSASRRFIQLSYGCLISNNSYFIKIEVKNLYEFMKPWS